MTIKSGDRHTHSLKTTDRDGDEVAMHRLARGGVSLRIASNDGGGAAYFENEDVLEVIEFLKTSYRPEIECDKCQGKGKVLK